MLSVIIPMYRTAEFVPELIREFERIADVAQERFGESCEFVFVNDGSPDDSHARLAAALPRARIAAQLVDHSRNFGSFAAIRTGLAAGTGDYFAVIAADLQEPPELMLDFLAILSRDEADVVVGRREGRNDPAGSKLSANLFWTLYRRLVMPEIPPGGVDVFGCNRAFRDELLRLAESKSSLVGQLFWIGFRRAEAPYERRPRAQGVSGWTWRKKLAYLSDSIFAFTDLPIRLLLLLGSAGLLLASGLGGMVTVLKLAGIIRVPGYTATVLTVAFFGAINILGLGVVGSYASRAYENTKGRPVSIVRAARRFGAAGSSRARTREG